MRGYLRVLTAVSLFLLVPVAAHAQATLSGLVRDASGAVLPGVVVEATSPALIEKVRSVVTDGTGQYRIIDLRPGTYTVTATLSGFSVVRREGIELSGTFVATVNLDLRVGSLEETITVTGESPLVDVRNSVSQSVMDRQTLDTIPTGKDPFAVGQLIPGVTTTFLFPGIALSTSRADAAPAGFEL